MIDTGAEVNICKYNCLPEDNWEKFKTPKTEEEDTIEKILKAVTTLCTKVDSMDNEIQKLKTNEDNLKSKASQQHDYKNVELRQSEDGKNPELKGDDGKLLKTHNVCLNTAAGTSKQVIKIGLTKDMIIPEDIGQQEEICKIEIPSFYANKRIIEERPATKALKEGFISTELLTRYCKLIEHKYPDHICSKCNREDKIIPDVDLE
ncbi:hypothetical protein H5410_061664 [Solanum commersonii]|uniref:Uncharacterized protein n=1 Tax=Solanum commersonii TaxID=4109 RepID=A0A9J5W8M9_SOLCO|nr:hypothetical protein H5410_061664 [Solanum commersonii]